MIATNAKSLILLLALVVPSSADYALLCYTASYEPVYEDGSLSFYDCVFTVYAVESLDIAQRRQRAHNPDCDDPLICAAACLNGMCLSYDTSAKLFRLKYKYVAWLAIVSTLYVLAVSCVLWKKTRRIIEVLDSLLVYHKNAKRAFLDDSFEDTPVSASNSGQNEQVLEERLVLPRAWL